jgi:hypothetical protein
MRVENVQLPRNGFFGVSAATGGLAGEDVYIGNVRHFALTGPLNMIHRRPRCAQVCHAQSSNAGYGAATG